jgi:hypothetical protein
VTTCACGLSLDDPPSGPFWRPEKDLEPPKRVREVVRWGESANMRVAVRVDDGWVEHGALVNYYRDRTPPMPWSQVGDCWAGNSHAVVPISLSSKEG